MQLKSTSQLKYQFLYNPADTVLQSSIVAAGLHQVTLLFGQAVQYSSILICVINWG